MYVIVGHPKTTITEQNKHIVEEHATILLLFKFALPSCETINNDLGTLARLWLYILHPVNTVLSITQICGYFVHLKTECTVSST